MLIIAIAISLMLGFVLFEVAGVVAGGLVSPGYFALYWDRPAGIALALGIALLTLIILRCVGACAVVYGRRRFLLALLIAFFLQWTIGSAVMGLSMSEGRMDIVGYLIPGLVAHEMDRQGLGITLAALLLLTAATRLCLVGAGLV